MAHFFKNLYFFLKLAFYKYMTYEDKIFHFIMLEIQQWLFKRFCNFMNIAVIVFGQGCNSCVKKFKNTEL